VFGHVRVGSVEYGFVPDVGLESREMVEHCLCTGRVGPVRSQTAFKPYRCADTFPTRSVVVFAIGPICLRNCHAYN